MRRIIVVLIAVILMFNTAVAADTSPDTGERDILAAFTVSPEYYSNSTVIRLSELSAASGLGFSYMPGTGFLYAEDGGYGIFIKELDENIVLDENAVTIAGAEGMQLIFPYSFKVFIYICRQEAEAAADGIYLAPQLHYGGSGNVSAMAEATFEFNSDKLKLVLRKLGTSSQMIDEGNIAEFLKDNLLLVNKRNTLERDYTPPGLIYSKPARGRSSVNLRLDGEAMLNLNYMLEAAYSEGISGMVITSAYRTFDKQTSLFNNKTSVLSRKMSRKTAMEEASKVVAIPGSSEHQTGLAADIISERVGLVSSFGNTVQGKWLEENSWRYGFIIRYPREKTEITGIIYEPWHVRYIGSGHSEIMKSRDLCLEEYVDYLKDNRIIYFNGSNGEDYVIRYISREELTSGSMALSLPENSTWEISNCTKDSYILTIKL